MLGEDTGVNLLLGILINLAQKVGRTELSLKLQLVKKQQSLSLTRTGDV